MYSLKFIVLVRVLQRNRLIGYTQKGDTDDTDTDRYRYRYRDGDDRDRERYYGNCLT